MKNKVNYMQKIIFINLFHARRGKWRSKNKAESRKIASQLFPIYFGGWILFELKCEPRSYIGSSVNH